MKISVITPTIRGNEALKRPHLSLDKQTFKDFEWIIKRHDPSLPPSLNKDLNEGIREAQGELIVFLQDYISIPRDGLEQFWCSYEENPTVFWTSPVGKTLDDELVEWEWRAYLTGDEELDFPQWEIDWAAAPKYALEEIGGFDEELDKQWGYDNVNIGLRAHLAGYKIMCLPKNGAVAWDHDLVMEHPYIKLKDALFHNNRLEEIRNGLKISYL